MEVSPAVKEEEETVKEQEEESVQPAADQKDTPMTEKQLSEIAEALSVLTARSSIMKERDELKSLLEDNLLSEAVSSRDKGRLRKLIIFVSQESKERQEGASPTVAVSKRVRAMIKKIDTQLEKYDERVDSSLNVIKTTPLGQIPVEDLKKALKEMKHRPAE